MPKLSLTDKILKVPLIGPEYARKLAKLEIHTVENLLHHYPAKYLDRTETTKIEDLVEGESVTIVAEVMDFKNVRTRYGKNLQQAVVADETDHLQITWFNQPYLERAIQVGESYAFSGKAKTYRNKLTMSAPEFEKVATDFDSEQLHTGRLVPVYPETAGVSSKWLRSRIQQTLKLLTGTDHLTDQIKEQNQLISLKPALDAIHFPPDKTALEEAKKRLGFDELFFLQLEGALRRHSWNQKRTTAVQVDQKKIKQFYSSLPFELTSAQQKAIKEILADLEKTVPMNRLLEGDVGSGKTVVAATALLATVLSGQNTLFMAPTEILAIQHYKELHKLLDGSGITIGLQTGSKKTEPADILVGTHALLFNLEKAQNVGLVVIDEQHRFGVEQRAKLENLPSQPHRLTMSATPIPRTVALTLYGDLDISLIDEMPKQRKAVKTWIVPEQKRMNGYKWIQDQMKEHKSQTFVVCPLIDPSESEKLANVRSASQEYDYLKPIFKNYQLSLLHGRIKSNQKDQIIKDFKAKKSDVLVTTPVIEVGIDVPNATIMLIEAADRFGLAQLHQLRGRVGRGDKQSYCLLFTSNEDKQTSSRLKALTKHNSGFKLAEIDLKLRGPGEVFGVSQHGFSQLKIARLSDKKLMKKSQEAAQQLVATNPLLSNLSILKKKLDLRMKASVSAG